MYDSKEEYYRVTADELKGVDMLLDEASVTGTANIIMTAVMAKGKQLFTMLLVNLTYNNFAKCLNSMGAKITGIGSNLIIH